MITKSRILCLVAVAAVVCFGTALLVSRAHAEEPGATMPRILCDDPADFKLLGRLRQDTGDWNVLVNKINMSHADWLRHPSCIIKRVAYSVLAPAGKVYVAGKMYDIWKVELWVDNVDPLPVKYLLRPAEDSPVIWPA